MADRSGKGDQRAWNEALDWLFRIERRPGDPDLERALSAWLDADEAHARAYAQARRIWDLSPGLRPSRSARAAGARRAGGAAAGLLGRRRLVTGAGALAAGAAAFLVASRWTDLTSDHVTGIGRAELVVLEDGSRVELNTDSAVSVHYEPGRRGIALRRGEAFFDVVPDAGRPFAVAAGPALVEVLGTRFNLRRGTAKLGLAVEEGRVAVSLAGRDLLAGNPLGRGETARIDLQTGAVERGRAAPDTLALWRRGQLVVERWPVSRVLDEIGRYRPGYIVLRDEALGARRVSGIYDLTRPVEAVRAVAQAFGGRVTEIGPYLLVVSGP